MVATRRGVRVCSPTKTNSDDSAGVQATPSAGRRTRRTAKQEETSSQAEGICQGDDEEEGIPLSPQSQCSVATRRCTRASRLHSPAPSTPVDSTHEADESDLESCCSAASGVEQLTTRRSRRHAVSQAGADLSDRELLASATPASKQGQRARRGTRSARKENVQQRLDVAHVEAGDGEASVVSEAESCNSVASESHRVTRSQRKGAATGSKAKQSKEDQELSEADSCTSSVSGAQVPIPTSGRTTRSRRSAVTLSFPTNLDEASEGSQSPALSGSRTRAARGRTAASVVVSEPQSCDSEGFESGPSVTPARTTRRQRKAKSTSVVTSDSDSELTDVHSPQTSGCSTQGRGTPCSSRTGSGNSSRTGPTTRLSAKVLSIVLEKTSMDGVTEEEQPGEDGPVGTMPMEVDSQASEVTISEMSVEENELNDSRLESTLNEEQDCTVIEENITLLLEEEEEEDVTTTDPASKDAQPEEAELIEVGHRGSVIMSVADADIGAPNSNQEQTLHPTETEDGMTAIAMDDENTNAPEGSNVSVKGSITVSDNHAEEAEAPGEPAVAAGEQQRELSAEDKDEDASEKATTEETVPPTELVEPPCSQSVTVTECERPDGRLEVTEEKGENNEAMEIDEADAHADIQQSQSEGPDDGPTDGDAAMGEEMEGSVSSADAQQAVGPREAPPSPSEPGLTQAEAVQVTSSQTPTVMVSSLEAETRDSVIIKKAGVISLLESSDEEEDVEEEEEEDVEEEEEKEKESSGEDDLPCSAEDLAGPSQLAGTASADGLFVIDTQPGLQADKQYYKDGLSTEEEMAKPAEEDEEFVDEDGDDDDEDAEILFTNSNPELKELSSRIDPGLKVKELGGLYINFDGSKSKPVSTSLKKLKEQKIQDEVMKRSVIGPDFEKKDAVPPYSESKQALKLKRREEREKTTGDGWFNMKAPELTQELKGDLKVLQMRGAMDSKRFYKKNDRDGFPKYFQVGTVVDNPVDFYHSRVPKKERKRTMVEELLADAEFRHNNKKKYQQIMMEKAAQGAGKKNKKKSKFHKK